VPGPRALITASEPGVELAVVVPTFQERDNIAPLIARLAAALAGIAWEVVFVDDDSPDGTAAVVRVCARADRRVRIVQRLGRRGLSGACVEGMLSSAAPYVAVMDADLQHDETLLPRMLARLRAGELDLIIGSRYAAGGSTGEWSRRRLLLSRLGIRGAQWLLHQQNLRDPLSGFFMLRREIFAGCVRRLSQQGFKVLLDTRASTGSAASAHWRTSVLVRCSTCAARSGGWRVLPVPWSVPRGTLARRAFSPGGSRAAGRDRQASVRPDRGADPIDATSVANGCVAAATVTAGAS
jgi:cellulose synthase/poly-beta-1,6-N-acetylglucosamine synthase-like glycosyltransferase